MIGDNKINFDTIEIIYRTNVEYNINIIKMTQNSLRITSIDESKSPKLPILFRVKNQTFVIKTHLGAFKQYLYFTERPALHFLKKNFNPF